MNYSNFNQAELINILLNTVRYAAGKPLLPLPVRTKKGLKTNPPVLNGETPALEDVKAFILHKLEKAEERNAHG